MKRARNLAMLTVKKSSFASLDMATDLPESTTPSTIPSKLVDPNTLKELENGDLPSPRIEIPEQLKMSYLV